VHELGRLNTTGIDRIERHIIPLLEPRRVKDLTKTDIKQALKETKDAAFTQDEEAAWKVACDWKTARGVFHPSYWVARRRISRATARPANPEYCIAANGCHSNIECVQPERDICADQRLYCIYRSAEL